MERNSILYNWKYIAGILLIVVGVISIVYGLKIKSMQVWSNGLCGITTAIVVMDSERERRELEKIKEEQEHMIIKQSEVIRRLMNGE